MPLETSNASALSNHIWGDGWQTVRAQWNLDPSIAHLNHGSFGAVPRQVLELRDKLAREAEGNPNSFFGRQLRGLLAKARDQSARFLNTDPERLAFVRNVTAGVGDVLGSLHLGPADEILMTDHAYGAVQMSIGAMASATGAQPVVVSVPLEAGDDGIVELLRQALTERTRLAVVDHVTSPTARVFPVRRIVEVLSQVGVPTFIDGAHSPGMFDLNLDDLGAAAWVGNFHKWCCAPRGACGLAISESMLDVVRPQVVSWWYEEGFQGAYSWLGTDDYSTYLCVPEATEFLGSLGWQKLRSHNIALAALAGETVSEALGGGYVAPVGEPASMALIQLPSGVADSPEKAAALVARIGDELKCEVAINAWHERGYLRLSAHAYNAPGEYERLALGLRKLL